MEPSRRSVLNSIGKAGITSSGVALASGTGTASRKTISGDLEVKEVSGQERQRLLRHVRNESEALIRHVSEEYRVIPNYREAAVDHAQSEDSGGYSVVIPFLSRSRDSDGGDPDMILLWTTSDEAETAIYGHDFGERETTVYKLGTSGEVVTEVTEWSDQTPTSKPRLRPASDCDCSEEKPYECEAYVCDEFNAFCVARIIGSGAAAIGACALGCYADPSKRICTICLGAALNAIGSLGCDPGDNCRWEETCHDFEGSGIRNCTPAHPSVDPNGRYC